MSSWLAGAEALHQPTVCSNWAWTFTPTALSSCVSWTTARLNQPKGSLRPSSWNRSRPGCPWPSRCIVAMKPALSATAHSGLKQIRCKQPRFITDLKADRDDLKRRAPGTALGPATTRFGDWARSFLGCDGKCQLVPSLRGRARIAGRATAKSVDRAKETF